MQIGLLAAALTTAVLVAACAQPARRGASGNTVDVVASFYPLAEAAERIGGGAVEVRNLTPPGVEPHDLELATDDMDAVIDADVVLYMGKGFQRALEEAVGRSRGILFDALKGKQLLEAQKEPGHEEAEEQAEGGEEGLDPHVWLDPRRWLAVARRMGSAFAEADPEHADGYRARARRYAKELRTLDAEFSRGLRSCDRDVIVTSHTAFGYLAARYGLKQEAISGISPEAEPDPRRLAELADLVERGGVTTVYTETLVSADAAETLARETGIDVRTLNPLEGLTEREIERGEDYVSVMRANLRELRGGLGCD